MLLEGSRLDAIYRGKGDYMLLEGDDKIILDGRVIKRHFRRKWDEMLLEGKENRG